LLEWFNYSHQAGLILPGERLENVTQSFFNNGGQFGRGLELNETSVGMLVMKGRRETRMLGIVVVAKDFAVFQEDYQ